MKTAFLFPGQGAQTVGMGQDLYNHYTDYKQTFDACQQGAERDLRAACFEGRGMDESEMVQPAIFAHSISLFALLKSEGIKPQICAGLSLGEYSALCAAGVFAPLQCAALVRKRGRMMDDAFPSGTGGMLSVIGFTAAQVNAVIEGYEDAYLANHLSELQTVIAGRTKDLEALKKLFENKGAKLVTLLAVKGPSHAPLLNDASEAFFSVLQNEPFGGMTCTVYSNVLGGPYGKSSDVRSLLVQQMCKRVRWHDCVEHMLEEGVMRFIEVGPSNVLTKLIKRRAGKGIETASVRDRRTLEDFLARYK